MAAFLASRSHLGWILQQHHIASCLQSDAQAKMSRLRGGDVFLASTVQ